MSFRNQNRRASTLFNPCCSPLLTDVPLGRRAGEPKAAIVSAQGVVQIVRKPGHGESSGRLPGPGALPVRVRLVSGRAGRMGERRRRCLICFVFVCFRDAVIFRLVLFVYLFAVMVGCCRTCFNLVETASRILMQSQPFRELVCPWSEEV